MHARSLAPFPDMPPLPPPEHPAASHDRSVRELRTRATLALVALGVTVLARASDIATRQWSISVTETFVSADAETQQALQPQLELADTLVNATTFAINGMLLVTAILFLRWMHRLVRLTRALGVRDMKWRPGQAVWAFIIPIVSWYRPYQILRDVQQWLEPEAIAPPAPRVDRDGLVDYRTAPLVMPPLAKALPSSFLGAWWALFVLVNLLSRVLNAATKSATELDAIITAYRADMFVSVLAIAAAVLATRVVRSLTARLDERFRRIRHATPEALAAQQIELSADDA